MNIMRMQYFVDVARMENVTKAAQQNYISQTAMSQQIANIENELEVKLFTREKGRLHLTQAGQTFYEGCLKMLKLYQDVTRETKEAWDLQYGLGQIVIGILTSSTVEYLEIIREQFNEKYPDIHIKFSQGSFRELRCQMEQGELDIAICPDFNLKGIPTIDTRVLAHEKMGLLVNKKHPLAKKKCVTVKDIKKEKIIMTEPRWAGGSYEQMRLCCQEDGFEPNIVEEASSAAIHTMLVSMDRGCAFLPERIAVYDHRKCVMLHLTDSKQISHVSIGWKKKKEHTPLYYFIQLVCSFYENDYEKWVRQYMKAGRSEGGT
ncbi:HTH-type transcriptional regulator gltC [uncultured Roseburia sp.]|uniref:LysR family transcriptional regulator n=1 Tax=Brotonthovivens ammoniilytica TaxID=2981725 RepID=A0ABT2TIT0_9FIRM|nr:LysR family transcriptional regulator [Brotonthovivens ammoniilytica]MCU6761581.1 LysR family transcriptional regulator [Brotonthovivens ammoniilytica]SCI32650.1 HTH-type transcriptional regulator gltC [uncultured Roseburia sp.]